jgi:hypothetical protein
LRRNQQAAGRRGLVCREFGGAAEDDEFGGDVLVPAGKKKWGDFN